MKDTRLLMQAFKTYVSVYRRFEHDTGGRGREIIGKALRRYQRRLAA